MKLDSFLRIGRQPLAEQNIFQCASLLIILILLGSCSAQPSITPTTQSANPPHVTPPSQTATPTLTITPQATVIQVAATITATLSPTLAAPTPGAINGPAPWIAIHEYNPGDETAGYLEDWLVGGKDGSSQQILNVPFPTPAADQIRFRSWHLAPAAGGLIAAYSAIFEWPFSTQTIEDPANQIWLIQLPENRVVRSLPLLGPAGLSQIEKEIEEIKKADLNRTLPVTLATLGNPHWSPDGQFLAYSAALDSPKADLYLYDRLRDETRRLTSGQDNAWVSSWSPDSERLLFYEVSWQGYSKINSISFSSLNVVSINGETQQLEKTIVHNMIDYGESEGAKWLDSQNILLFKKMDQWGGDTFLGDLRIFNLQTSKTRTLFQDQFYHLAVDPESSTVLIATHDYIPPVDPPAGVYQINIQTGELKPLRQGATIYMNWCPNLGLFSLRYNANSVQDGLAYDYAYITVRGEQKIRLDQVSGDIFLSPDGKWFLISQPDKIILKDASGKDIKQFALRPSYDQSGHTFTWLADSSGFYITGSQYDPNEARKSINYIYYYSKESNWSEELIYTGPISYWPYPALSLLP